MEGKVSVSLRDVITVLSRILGLGGRGAGKMLALGRVGGYGGILCQEKFDFYIATWRSYLVQNEGEVGGDLEYLGRS